jgi:sigma-B regulation protein RsbU (phosphoserine phosphatase)
MTTKVLVVDDDTIVLDYLRQLVTTAGYAVVTATSAEAALDCMQVDFAQILILDISMPGMDGLSLCRAIRRRSYAGYVYVILHTARNTAADILEGLDAGADDYMSKGTSNAQILGRLHTAQRILSLEQSLKTSSGRNELVAAIDSGAAPHT